MIRAIQNLRVKYLVRKMFKDFKKKLNSKDVSTESNYDPHYTWIEALLIPYMSVLYLASWGISVSIIIDKYNDEEPPESVFFFYVFFFVLSHVFAGLKNLQYHYKEVHNEGKAPKWILYMLFFPLSPLIRYMRAWMFGKRENGTWQGSVRFVNECIILAVLRLFDTMLGLVPIIILLLRDDIWNRSSDWQLLIIGSNPSISCYPYCTDVEIPNVRWIIARLVFFVAQVALNLTFYNLMVKRYQHLESPELFAHYRSPSVRSGKINIFGSMIMFGGHFSFASSRLLGYSMVVTAARYYFFLVISIRWTINIVWHLLTTIITPRFAARYLSSVSMGGVWLFGLTNEVGGYQLGRFFLYYFVAVAETCVCCTIWYKIMEDSGDYFTTNAVWAVLVFMILSGILHGFYYSACHPSRPSVSRRGLICCSLDRRERPEDEYHEEADYESSDSRNTTQSAV